MKVVESPMSANWMIVRNDWGTVRENNGVKFSYEPIPFARVPWGYGRTKEEARLLADQLCVLMNTQENI